MPVELPNLDDRTYTDLVQEGVALIQQHAPRWTNHNPTDPGITLIELLAYFTEMLIYRLDQISRDAKIQFLYLLRGADWDSEDGLDDATADEIESRIKRAVAALRTPQRAVTVEDFEDLAIRATAEGTVPGTVLRAHAEIGKNLATDPAYWDNDTPGHISVVILPDRTGTNESTLTGLVRDFLEPRCLLTTRLHIVEPRYLHLMFGLAIDPDAVHRSDSLEAIQHELTAALEQYFSPYPGGGPAEQGWPFGRMVNLPQAFDVLHRLPHGEAAKELRLLQLSSSDEALHAARSALGIQVGIRSTVGLDSHLGTRSSGQAHRLARRENGELYAIALRPYELVKVGVQVVIGSSAFPRSDEA